jgi:hypothetical protein
MSVLSARPEWLTAQCVDTLSPKRGLGPPLGRFYRRRNAGRGLQTVDGGLDGQSMEWMYNVNDDAFIMVLRRGTAGNLPNPNYSGQILPYQTNDFYVARVMFTDFTKEVVHRGKTDLWNIDVTLEEV